VLVLDCQRWWRLGRGRRRIVGRVGGFMEELWEMRKRMCKVQ
jgi:hypothetical protein